MQMKKTKQKQNKEMIYKITTHDKKLKREHHELNKNLGCVRAKRMFGLS
jgi:hypothetical protein